MKSKMFDIKNPILALRSQNYDLGFKTLTLKARF